MTSGNDAPIAIEGTRTTRTTAPRTFANVVSEMALAHTIGDKAEAAYRRGDLFNKRTKLMQAWNRYCDEAKPVKVSDANEADREHGAAV